MTDKHKEPNLGYLVPISANYWLTCNLYNYNHKGGVKSLMDRVGHAMNMITQSKVYKKSHHKIKNDSISKCNNMTPNALNMQVHETLLKNLQKHCQIQDFCR
jgi:hypothetical protein